MRNLYTLLMAFTLIFVSCDTDKEEYVDLQTKDFNVTAKVQGKSTPPATCAEAQIMAGQHYVAGKLYVSLGKNTLLVTYMTVDGWVIDETHMFIGDREDIPTNGGGMPRIGHFPYKATHDFGTNEVTYSIPLSEVPDCFTVAAHAVVSKVDDSGTVIGNETAWSQGERIGRNWSMATDFCKSGCKALPEDGPIRRR